MTAHLDLHDPTATIHDISVPIRADMATWHNLHRPHQAWRSRTAVGDRTSLSTWTMDSHTGTHLDAPLHHLPGGAPTSEVDLGRLVGLCRVLDLTTAAGHITAADLEHHVPARGERLLLKTRNSTRGLLRDGSFAPDYVGLAPDAARLLVDRGVSTVGVDYLSVEPPEHADFVTHHTLLGADTAVLEGILLDHITPGPYLLACLPLALTDAEAAPARAVLLTTPGAAPGAAVPNQARPATTELP